MIRRTDVQTHSTCNSCRRSEPQCGDRLIWLTEKNGNTFQVCDDCLMEWGYKNIHEKMDFLPDPTIGGILMRVFSYVAPEEY